MNAPFATSLSALLRRGAAGFALVALVAGCSGSHASDSGTAASDAAASPAAGASSAPDATTSSAPDATASGDAGAGPAGGGGGGGRAGGRRLMAKALASVGLSDDQKSQIRSIMKAARAENASATDPETKRANYRAAFAKVQAVLTPDQRTAFQAKMAELRAQAAQTQ